MRTRGSQAGRGSEPGQGRAAVGDWKKGSEATVEQARAKYAFSERRACGPMMVAVTTYQYRSQHSDEPLRTKPVELEREKTRFGYRRTQLSSYSTGESSRQLPKHGIVHSGPVLDCRIN